jgi:ribosomal protein S18 acetylase RimI-like enzyme
MRELHDEGRIYGLLYDGRPAGFIGEKEGVLVLHAMAAKMRGKGLARALWTLAILDLFEQGRADLHSSVSAGNLPIVNLYASIRRPGDGREPQWPRPYQPAVKSSISPQTRSWSSAPSEL